MIRSVMLACVIAAMAAAPAFAETKNAQCARLYNSALTNNENITELTGGIVFDAGDGVRARRYDQRVATSFANLNASIIALTDFGGRVNFGGDEWERHGITANDDWETPLMGLRADLARLAPAIRADAPMTQAQIVELRRISRAIAAVNRGNCR